MGFEVLRAFIWLVLILALGFIGWMLLHEGYETGALGVFALAAAFIVPLFGKEPPGCL